MPINDILTFCVVNKNIPVVLSQVSSCRTALFPPSQISTQNPPDCLVVALSYRDLSKSSIYQTPYALLQLIVTPKSQNDTIEWSTEQRGALTKQRVSACAYLKAALGGFCAQEV